MDGRRLFCETRWGTDDGHHWKLVERFEEPVGEREQRLALPARCAWTQRTTVLAVELRWLVNRLTACCTANFGVLLHVRSLLVIIGAWGRSARSVAGRGGNQASL